MDYIDLKQKLKHAVQERMDYGRDYTDEEVDELIDETILLREELSLYSVESRRQLKKELFNSLRKLDILQGFVDDSTITEIMVNGTDPIFVEQNGHLKQLDVKFESLEKLEDVIQKIVAGCNRVVNEASPIVDARLENGSRVNIVLQPIALNGPIVTIRRFPEHPITMRQLVEMESITVEAAAFLKKLVKAGYNLFISGGTGSGKTTFLNALSGYITKENRVITIEDSAELQLQGIPNLVQLETRNSNVEGCREITIRDLIKASLRMRPEPPHYKKANIRALKKESHHPMYTPELLLSLLHSSHLQTDRKETSSSWRFPATVLQMSFLQMQIFLHRFLLSLSPCSQLPERGLHSLSEQLYTSMPQILLRGSQ